MAVGAILKEAGLIVEKMIVESSEDIEIGEIVENAGAGIVAASDASKGPFFMALESMIYADVTDYTMEVVVAGEVTVQKKSGLGANKHGRYVELSADDGEVTIYDYSTGNWYDVVGVQVEDSSSGDDSVNIRIGVK